MDPEPETSIDLDEFVAALSGLMPGNNYTLNTGNSTIDTPPYTLWELINTGEGYLFLLLLLTAGDFEYNKMEKLQ